MTSLFSPARAVLVASILLPVALTGATAAFSSAAGVPTPARTSWVDQARLDSAASEPANWLTYGGTYQEQRFSTLDQINEQTLPHLGLGWSFEFDTNRGQEATPLVVDGIMYISTAWSKVFALDARTGKEVWRFDPHVPGSAAVFGCCDVVNRGVAIWKGRVFVGTIDGRLIALDAATGKQAWSVQTTDPAKPYTITGAPRVVRDKVIIGNGGAEYGVRGYVSAYDTQTGKQVWRFYTVPPPSAKLLDHAASDPVMAMAARTWFGTEWHESGGGGTVWDSIVYDPELNLLYIGVGNGGVWNRQVRSAGKGDNLFIASIVALDPDTGAYRWHYQETPGDSFDFTSSQQMTLATLPIGGVATKVLLHAPKNGFFYIIDRANGRLISARNFAPVTWADGVDLKTGRPHFTDNAFYDHGPKLFLPASLGAHSWHPMSFSPRTGLVYIPTMQMPVVYAQDPDFKFIPGRMNFGLLASLAGPDAPPAGTALIAWDPLAQKEIWRVPQPELWPGGVLSTAGNLVFSGNAHGEFSAYRANDGTALWTFRQQAGIMAGPISYAIDGTQYVAVAAGYGGALPLIVRDPNRPQRLQPMGRMLAFRLGGTAETPDVDLTMPPPNPPQESFSSEAVANGNRLYGQQCMFCHSGSVLPDLRRSFALTDRQLWQQIVMDGILTPRGMVSFKRWLNAEDAEAIRAYIASEARTLATTTSKQ